MPIIPLRSGGTDEQSSIYKRLHRGEKYEEKRGVGHPLEKKDYCCQKCGKKMKIFRHPSVRGYRFCPYVGEQSFKDFEREGLERYRKKKEDKNK